MCCLRNIAMRNYQESVTIGQTDTHTDGRTDRQMLDKMIPICRYASQATQKFCTKANIIDFFLLIIYITFRLNACTGRMETHIDNIDDCKRLAKQCKMTRLLEEIDTKYKKQLSFGKHKILYTALNLPSRIFAQ